MAQVSLNIDAETAKAVRALVQVAASQDKIEKSTDRASRASKKQKQTTEATTGAFDKMGRAAVSAFAGFLGAAAVVKLLRSVKNEIIAVDEELGKIARKQSSIGDEAVALTAINPNLPAREVVNTAILKGTEAGVGARDALSVIQVLQSQSKIGTFEKALKASEAVFALQNFGVDTASAISTAKFFVNQDLSTAKGAGALLLASDTSSFGPAGIAKAAPALPSFSDPRIGLAFASGISAGVDNPEQLRTFTEQAAFGINLRNTLTDKLSKTLKVQGLAGEGKTASEIAKALELKRKDVEKILEGPELAGEFGADYFALNEVQKVALIREAVPGIKGGTTGDITLALQNAGLTEKRSVLGLRQLLGDESFGNLTNLVTDINAAPEDLIFKRFAAERERNPFFEDKLIRGETAATVEASDLLDEVARKNGAARLRAGAALTETGGYAARRFVERDGDKAGEATLIGRIIQFHRDEIDKVRRLESKKTGAEKRQEYKEILEERTLEGMRGQIVDRNEETIRRLGDQLGSHAEALDKNTAAMESNTDTAVEITRLGREMEPRQLEYWRDYSTPALREDSE